MIECCLVGGVACCRQPSASGNRPMRRSYSLSPQQVLLCGRRKSYFVGRLSILPSFSFHAAKIQHFHCGLRINPRLFFVCMHFFSPSRIFSVPAHFPWLTILLVHSDSALLQCCSVAVLLRVFADPKNTSIFIYIYKYRVNS